MTFCVLCPLPASLRAGAPRMRARLAFNVWEQGETGTAGCALRASPKDSCGRR